MFRDVGGHVGGGNVLDKERTEFHLPGPLVWVSVCHVVF